jgi:hypothetical protein
MCYEAGSRKASCITVSSIVYREMRKELGPFYPSVSLKIADFCEVSCQEGKRDPNGYRKILYSHFFNSICKRMSFSTIGLILS